MEGRIDFKLSLLLFSCPTFGIFKIRPMMSLLNTKTLALVTLVTCAAVASPVDAQTTLEKKSLGLPGWELHQQGDLFGDPATPLSDAAHELDDDGGQTALFQPDVFTPPPGPGAAIEQISQLEQITQLLGVSPVSIDDLVRASGLPVAVVQAALFDLELSGKLVRTGGNLVARAPG